MIRLRHIISIQAIWGIFIAISLITRLDKQAFSQQDPSPDEFIAFAMFQIQLTDLNGDDIIQVADVRPGPARHPTWSPDGDQIAFEVTIWTELNDTTSQIFIVDVETGDVTQLTTGSSNYSPAWSPSGQYLSVVARDPTTSNETWLMSAIDLETSRPTPLATVGGHAAISQYNDTVTWSPDSDAIVFINDFQLYLLSLNGSVEDTSDDSLIVLTDELQLCGEGYSVGYANPSWNPLENMIAVLVSCGSQHTDIYLLEIDDTWNITSYSNLTNTEIADDTIGFGYGLDWSPDGHQLVYTSSINQRDNGALFVADLGPDFTDFEVTRITDDYWISPRDPAWRPHDNLTDTN